MADTKQVIVYKNEDGSISVVHPSPNTKKSLAEIAAQAVPVGAKSVTIIDSEELPKDKYFRNAWELKNKKITHNMDKAKEIQKDKLRALRNPLLAKLDVEYIRALEQEDNKETQKVLAKKQALRDLTDSSDIEEAKNVEELKVAGLSIIEDLQE
jgi:hypothetical protein